MPTTARGIWTPSDTDAVDFTTHLATMAGTIDTAITNGLNTIGAGANAFKGTAAQRAAFLSTAVNGMLWQDTDSIKMIWRKDGAAWVPAVWRWSGTTAQMNAFAAPNGFEWFNTTDNSDYVRLGGAWSAEIGPWLQVMPAGTSLPAGRLRFNSGWSSITSPYWDGIWHRTTPSGVQLQGACTKSSAAAALEEPIEASSLLATPVNSYIPTVFGTAGGYSVVVKTGRFHIASSLGAGVQLTIGGFTGR